MLVHECSRCGLRFVEPHGRPAPASCPRCLARYPQDVEQINQELIEPAALGDDHKAALWLLAFALLDPQPPAPPASRTSSPRRRRRS